jgi:hypothetical protein
MMGNEDQDGACFEHPKYAYYENRLSSFDNWPISLKIRPIELSEAGFFYTGRGDCTICFYCGLGLKDWEDSDDVWNEHARWSTKCNFVLLKKGKYLVNNSRNEQLKQTSDSDKVKKEVGDDEEPKMETRLLCKICLKNEMNTMFVPCFHIVACTGCALLVTNCPICRASCTSVTKVYLS